MFLALWAIAHYLNLLKQEIFLFMEGMSPPPTTSLQSLSFDKVDNPGYRLPAEALMHRVNVDLLQVKSIG